jgi:hypothetical protein
MSATSYPAVGAPAISWQGLLLSEPPRARGQESLGDAALQGQGELVK